MTQSICGSCGERKLPIKVTSVGAALCWTCARDFLAILDQEGLTNNPIAVDLMILCGKRVDSFEHHGFMIWGLQNKDRSYPWYYLDDSKCIY